MTASVLTPKTVDRIRRKIIREHRREHARRRKMSFAGFILLLMAVAMFCLLPLFAHANDQAQRVAVARARVAVAMAEKPKCQCQGVKEKCTCPKGQCDCTECKVTKAPTLEPKKTVVTKATHSHRCPYDGTVWSHTDDSFGSPKDHQCPKCGRVQWDVYQAPKVVKAQSNCPSGVCPVPRTRLKLFQ